MKKFSLKKATLACVLCLAVFAQGCVLPAWVGEVGTIVSALAPAVINILQIISIAEGKPMSSTLAAKITADAANIKVLANDFATASAAAAPASCAQLQAGLATFTADEQTVLGLVNISDPVTQQKATLLLGIVTSAFSTIVALIPACNAPVALRESLAKATPAVNGNQFVSSYNKGLVVKTGHAAVDAYTAKHKIHAHSGLVRVLSLGWQK
jgi:hypothetical protein